MMNIKKAKLIEKVIDTNFKSDIITEKIIEKSAAREKQNYRG